MEEKYTRDEARALKIGFTAALVLVAFAGYFSVLKEKVAHKESGQYYPLKASFGRTDGLLVGDKVRMAGMDIGRIVDAKLDDNFHAVLTLEVKDSVKVPDDSSASIVSSGIMGPKYIEIEPGGSEDYLPIDGQFSYTQDAMVLEELMDRIIGMGKANRTPKEREELKEFEQNINM